MTNEEIDALTGRELVWAVAQAIGWEISVSSQLPTGSWQVGIRHRKYGKMGGFGSTLEEGAMRACAGYNTPIGMCILIDHFKAIWKDEDEPRYWLFEDCVKYGWVARIMWDHHDGSVDWLEHPSKGETLPEAVCRAVLRYYQNHETATQDNQPSDLLALFGENEAQR